MASSSSEHVLNIAELANSARRKWDSLDPLSAHGNCCIYKVPHRMRISNEQHFTPQVVSIGPLHYGNEKLRAMEHLKERVLLDFLKYHIGVSLEDCFKFILENEKKLRDCYANIIELSSDNFVKMVLVDAAFLIMMLLRSYLEHWDFRDRFFGRPHMIEDIKCDFLLMENQLPLFILEGLYKFCKMHDPLAKGFGFNFKEEDAITVLAYHFFGKRILPNVREHRQNHPIYEAGSILHLLRNYSIPEGWATLRRATRNSTSIPGVKELYQAGVELQVGSQENMFNITFHDGILKIPRLTVDDNTELVFRNLLAFEQCHCPEDHIFSDYVELMQLMTFYPGDMELLMQNGVIKNELSDAERVTKLFQNISVGNVVRRYEFPYGDAVKNMKEYYDNDWHKWKATWKRKYFKAPWAFFSFSAAVLLLVLTIVQTVFTILQFVIPK